jgi:hypothetical protein
MHGLTGAARTHRHGSHNTACNKRAQWQSLQVKHGLISTHCLLLLLHHVFLLLLLLLQVCLVALQLRGDGFENFRCDRNVTLGIQLANFSKLLKCAGATQVVIAGSGVLCLAA